MFLEHVCMLPLLKSFNCLFFMLGILQIPANFLIPNANFSMKHSKVPKTAYQLKLQLRPLNLMIPSIVWYILQCGTRILSVHFSLADTTTGQAIQKGVVFWCIIPVQASWAVCGEALPKSPVATQSAEWWGILRGPRSGDFCRNQLIKYLINLSSHWPIHLMKGIIHSWGQFESESNTWFFLLRF